MYRIYLAKRTGRTRDCHIVTLPPLLGMVSPTIPSGQIRRSSISPHQSIQFRSINQSCRSGSSNRDCSLAKFVRIRPRQVRCLHPQVPRRFVPLRIAPISQEVRLSRSRSSKRFVKTMISSFDSFVELLGGLGSCQTGSVKWVLSSGSCLKKFSYGSLVLFAGLVGRIFCRLPRPNRTMLLTSDQ